MDTYWGCGNVLKAIRAVFLNFVVFVHGFENTHDLSLQDLQASRAHDSGPAFQTPPTGSPGRYVPTVRF